MASGRFSRAQRRSAPCINGVAVHCDASGGLLPIDVIYWSDGTIRDPDGNAVSALADLADFPAAQTAMKAACETRQVQAAIVCDGNGDPVLGEVLYDRYGSIVGSRISPIPSGWEECPCECSGSPEPRCYTIEDTDSPRPLANNGWNNQLITGSQGLTGDGEFCFTADETGNSASMIGLSLIPGLNASYTSITYAAYLYNNGGTYLLRLYSNGAYQGQVAGAWAPGHEICIVVSGTLVTLENRTTGNSANFTTPYAGAGVYPDSSYYSTTTGTWSSGDLMLSDISLCPTGDGIISSLRVSSAQRIEASASEAISSIREYAPTTLARRPESLPKGVR